MTVFATDSLILAGRSKWLFTLKEIGKAIYIQSQLEKVPVV